MGAREPAGGANTQCYATGRATNFEPIKEDELYVLRHCPMYNDLRDQLMVKRARPVSSMTI